MFSYQGFVIFFIYSFSLMLYRFVVHMNNSYRNMYTDSLALYHPNTIMFGLISRKSIHYFDMLTSELNCVQGMCFHTYYNSIGCYVTLFIALEQKTSVQNISKVLHTSYHWISTISSC